MDNGVYEFGFFSGAMAMALAAVILWHIGESDCQQEHDVYDCQSKAAWFEPVLSNEGDE